MRGWECEGWERGQGDGVGGGVRTVCVRITDYGCEIQRGQRGVEGGK